MAGLFILRKGMIDMVIIKNRLAIEMEPTVPEVCAVISAVTSFYPGKEVQLLEGIKKALDERIVELQSSSPPGDYDKEVKPD